MLLANSTNNPIIISKWAQTGYNFQQISHMNHNPFNLKYESTPVPLTRIKMYFLSLSLVKTIVSFILSLAIHIQCMWHSINSNNFSHDVMTWNLNDFSLNAYHVCVKHCSKYSGRHSTLLFASWAVDLQKVGWQCCQLSFVCVVCKHWKNTEHYPKLSSFMACSCKKSKLILIFGHEGGVVSETHTSYKTSPQLMDFMLIK